MLKAAWLKSVGACLVATAVAHADDQSVRTQETTTTTTETRSKDRRNEVHRASSLMNHNVMNDKNEKLGVIKDLVMNEMGKPKYVIIDQGGVLTDKYVAVPWNVLKPNFNADHCMLSMSLEKFQGAPTFTRGNYYEQWKPDWCNQLHAYFGDKQKADADRQTGQGEKQKHELYYSSQIIGSTVQNKDQEKIAKVQDLVCDGSHRFTYAVLGSGGFLNIGEKHIAVPLSALKLQKGEQGNAFATLDMTHKQLEAAPTLTKADYNDLLDKGFVDSNNKYFGVTGERREIEAESPVKPDQNPNR